jgi:hypothetical protein
MILHSTNDNNCEFGQGIQVWSRTQNLGNKDAPVQSIPQGHIGQTTEKQRKQTLRRDMSLLGLQMNRIVSDLQNGLWASEGCPARRWVGLG